MAGSSDSDEQEANASTLRDLLADLNSSPAGSGSRFNTSQPPAWAFSTTRSSPSPFAARPSSLLPRRTSSRENPYSIPEYDLSGQLNTSQPQTVFTTPSRSIFSSGPPTSSVSANTAQASMSAPPPANSTHQLSALTGPTITSSRRQGTHPVDVPQSSRRTRLSTRVEKDVDDPSNSMETPSLSRRIDTTTSTTLASLFATPDSASPSRQPSSARVPSVSYTRGRDNDSTPQIWVYRK